MKLIRTMMTTAALLLLAQTASAQALSLVALQALSDAEQRQSTAPSDCAGGCPMFGQNSWVNHLLQHSMTSWQRLSAVCGRGQIVCSFDGVSVAVGTRAKGNGAASPGCVKGGDAAAAQKCCCAKECACCESCATNPRYDRSAYPKQAYGDPVQARSAPPAFVHTPAWAWMPMQQGQTWLAPMPQPTPPQFMPNPRVIALPTPPAPHQMVRSAPVANTAARTQQAHLVTADFDIRCEQMTHRGDLILLEGSVRLVCLKQGRHMLVEAQRVMLNVRDGTFTVESDVRPVQPALQRTSAVEPLRPGVTVIAVPVR